MVHAIVIGGHLGDQVVHLFLKVFLLGFVLVVIVVIVILWLVDFSLMVRVRVRVLSFLVVVF